MGIKTQAQDGESDEGGEVDLKYELISALEELEKCRKNNKHSNQIISDLIPIFKRQRRFKRT